MDRFNLTLHPPLMDCPPQRRPYREAHIAINGRPLLELVRMAEERRVRAEYLERLPEFENSDVFRFELSGSVERPNGPAERSGGPSDAPSRPADSRTTPAANAEPVPHLRPR